MSVSPPLLSEALVARLGWTLLHFVWQGAALAALLAILLFLLRRRAASLRYLVCCMVLLLMTLSPSLTFLAIVSPSPQVALRVGKMPGDDTQAVNTLPEQHPEAANTPSGDAGNAVPAAFPFGALPARPLLDRLLPWLVFGWIAGVMLLCVRLAGGGIAVYQLTRRDARPITGGLEVRLQELARLMGVGRSVRLLESSRVEVPTVIGCMRAILLLPVSTLTGLPQQQIEALLAHELAHVRRYDHLINLWQVIVETLLFYHPAIWWVSQQIRLEREQCCDDLVVQTLNDRVTYARALASLEASRSSPGPLLLASDGGDLMARIRHILGLTPMPAKRSVPLAPASALLCAVLLLFLLAWQSHSPSHSSAAAGQKPRSEKVAGTKQNMGSGAGTPQDDRADPVRLALRQARDYYQSLSSFSMRIENHYTSGLFPTEYTQTLRWRKPDQFELMVTSKNNTRVPSYYADGEQLVTTLPEGRRYISPIQPEPNTAPGWEVSAGLILSWLQNTESGQWMLNGKALPPHIQFSLGPRTKWHGYRVRELLMKDQRTSAYYPHGTSTSFFLDAEKPRLIGSETNILHKIGWALYADQKANPSLPETLGQTLAAP